MIRATHISDTQTRRQFSLDELPLDAAFQALFEHWLSRRGVNGEPPCEDTFDPDTAVPASARPWLAAVDVLADDPYSYLFESHCPSDSWGRVAGRPVRDLPDLEHAHCLVDEFLFVKTRQEPRFDVIDQIAGGFHRHYARLAVPVICSRSGAVVRLYTAVKRLEPSRLVASSASDTAEATSSTISHPESQTIR